MRSMQDQLRIWMLMIRSSMKVRCVFVCIHIYTYIYTYIYICLIFILFMNICVYILLNKYIWLCIYDQPYVTKKLRLPKDCGKYGETPHLSRRLARAEAAKYHPRGKDPETGVKILEQHRPYPGNSGYGSSHVVRSLVSSACHLFIFYWV
jgi:hypothetical protein